MVHLAQDVDIEVAEVAGQEEGDDLAPAVLQGPVPVGPAGQDQVDGAGLLALAQDVLMRADLPHPLAGCALQHAFVVDGEPGELPQLADQGTRYTKGPEVIAQSTVEMRRGD